MRRRELMALAFYGWLLVGLRWAGVNAWEELTVQRKPFRTQATCEQELARQRQKANAAPVWNGARCVTEFKGSYPKSFQSEPFMDQ